MIDLTLGVPFAMAGLGSVLGFSLDRDVILGCVFYSSFQVSEHATWIDTWSNSRRGCCQLGGMPCIRILCSKLSEIVGGQRRCSSMRG